MNIYEKPLCEIVHLETGSLIASSYDRTVEKTSERASTDYDVLTRRKSEIWTYEEE